MARKITKKNEDFSKWYLDIVSQAELADYSPVKGCMVIRPYGYAIWELMQRALDDMIKATGHRNAYFPLFIPESFFKQEAEHVEGFAPECAVVTHGGGKKLEENLMVRPTSETIIYSMYAKWIQSYRDLPVMINQWANIVRWEMRTRPFLRTTEFLWQEGHTAHATEAEADAEARKMLDVYADFAQDFIAVPVVKGLKTEKEKFAGALRTYCIEAMMGDGKALQAGTSHMLGQNFSRAFNVRFQDQDGNMQYVWQTSWGVSTRLIGALIMAHSDDKGLVLPPRLAPDQVVFVPIFKSDDEKSKVCEAVNNLAGELKKSFRVRIDDREGITAGWKFNQYELLGVPVRVELGPKDLEKQQVVMVRRDTGEKKFISWDSINEEIKSWIDDIQHSLFDKAVTFRKENTVSVANYGEFKDLMASEDKFVEVNWCNKREFEDKIQEETKATIAAVPFDGNPAGKGPCMYSGEESTTRVIFAKSY